MTQKCFNHYIVISGTSTPHRMESNSPRVTSPNSFHVMLPKLQFGPTVLPNSHHRRKERAQHLHHAATMCATMGQILRGTESLPGSLPKAPFSQAAGAAVLREGNW